MNPGCQERHDELILALSEKQAFVPALREHLEACVECRALADRVRLSIDALVGLQPVPAPLDLDGRVVASLHAGFREDRTARHLEALPRMAAPQQLEENLANGDKVAKDLGARVELELAHPELVIGARLARIARRYSAPEELELLVACDLAAGPKGSTRRPLRLISGLMLAVTASLLISVNLQKVDRIKPSLDSLSFRVREVDSVSELNSMARLLMGGVTGGASEVREF